MAVQALGYVGIGAADLADWSAFATRQLGLQRVGDGNVSRSFRMDDRKQRLIVDAAGERYFGWEVADRAALRDLAARLDAAGVAVAAEPAALADRRHVSELISVRDPDSHRLEAFHGAQLADEPFKPGHNISGFKTGAQGLGHVVLLVADYARAMAFYQGLLGFRISDYLTRPFPGAFLHVNPRHHSLALFEHPQGGVHHLMMELYSLDDVGRSYDIATGAGRVAATLGRHHNDYMTSFYMRSPSSLLIEQGWGAREVDVARWRPEELSTLASFWGHDGLMQTVGDGPPPGAPPPPAPPEGRRAPVQVMAGNYERLNGVCPWWDATKAAR